MRAACCCCAATGRQLGWAGDHAMVLHRSTVLTIHPALLRCCSLNAGGPGPSSGFGTLVWPNSTQPTCGTPELAAAGAPLTSYTPGSGAGAGRGWVGWVTGWQRGWYGEWRWTGPSGVRFGGGKGWGGAGWSHQLCACSSPSLPASAALAKPPALLTRPTTPCCIPVIDIKVFFSTQHGGRHTFRLCPRPNADDDCFQQITLQR